MTKDNTLSSKAVVAVLTLMFSALMVLGAVGPAYGDHDQGQSSATGLANETGKSANSLA